MRVLICGDRNWTNRARILRALAKLPPGTEVIHGAARGADQIAGEEAQKLGFRVFAFPADWSKGRAAGPIRNRLMLDQKPDFVLAFHPDIKASKGTADTVREATRRGIKVLVINE
jgi:ABC-type sugar transport system substrate-binding protein